MKKNVSTKDKYTNQILDDIETYKLVLTRSLKQFPKGFWTKPWSLYSARQVTVYLLEERLQYSSSGISEKVTSKTFHDNKLGGMLVRLFNNSTFEAINNAYPNKYNRWQLRQATNGLWKDSENIISAIKWLVEDELNLTDEQVKKQFSAELLIRNNLATLANNYSIYELINMVYPGKYHEWELSRTPNKYWKEESNRGKAVRWVITEYLDNDNERVYREFTHSLLTSLGLHTLHKYKKYDLLDSAYPGRFDKSKLK